MPLFLQVRVIRSTAIACRNLVPVSLVWNTLDVSWEFWVTVGNNNTIGMDREELQKLPKSKDIRMKAT